MDKLGKLSPSSGPHHLASAVSGYTHYIAYILYIRDSQNLQKNWGVSREMCFNISIRVRQVRLGTR